MSMSLPDIVGAGMLTTDVEFGNADEFYQASRLCADPLRLGEAIASGEASRDWCGGIRRARLDLADLIVVNKQRQSFTRSLHITASVDSELFDVVSRFVVISDNPRAAEIGEQSYPHTGANLYRQYNAPIEVKVPVGHSNYLHFCSLGGLVPAGFDEVFYVRDASVHKDAFKWIVHHRLIATLNEARLVLRICNPRFEGPIVGDRLIPHALKRPFFRIREAKYPNCPIMAVGEVGLAEGTEAELATGVVLL